MFSGWKKGGIVGKICYFYPRVLSDNKEIRQLIISGSLIIARICVQ